MRWVEVWKLFAVQPGVFKLLLLLPLRFEVLFHKLWLLWYVHFLNPLEKILMVAASLLNLHLLASLLNLWTYVANDSLSVC